MQPTRGEFNNNPLNIRLGKAKWVGEVTNGTDKEFEQFDNIVHGIRAGAKLLCNYYRFGGISTIDQIISRLAPSSENDTKSYIDDVAKRMGIPSDQSLDLLDNAVLEQLVSAVIHHENGRVSCTFEQIQDGVKQALA